MPYFTYVLISEVTSKRYVGSCENLDDRLYRHNTGQSKATKHGAPWRLVHFEEFSERSEAVQRELFFKTGRGREELDRLDLSDSRGTPRCGDIALRDLEAPDLPILFAQQSDLEACRLAAVHPREWEAFNAHWDHARCNPAVVTKAILEQGSLVGQISFFNSGGVDYVGYWIAREYWGRGIATSALAQLLELVTTRPIHARVARHNVASIRVLERNGFTQIGHEWSPGDERYVACEEAILMLS
jgi:RimJ/RimL family protein N-acetyltransferase/predicted GIY-YIG superfamily endonuclease